MRLHGYWRSNATYRVRVALLLKGIAFEELEYDLLQGHQFSPEFLDLNPNAAVPALEVGGKVLTQSFAILDYLDTLPGGPRLIPENPLDRAEALALAMGTIADAHPLIVPRIRKYLAAEFGADEAQVKAWARHWLIEGQKAFEARLERQPPSPYVFGEAPGIADIAIASHVVAGTAFEVTTDDFPHLEALTDRLLALPEFAEAQPFRRREFVAQQAGS